MSLNLYQKTAEISPKSKTKIQANLPIIFVIKRGILPISILSLTSQKTSSIYNKLYVDDWC